MTSPANFPAFPPSVPPHERWSETEFSRHRWALLHGRMAAQHGYPPPGDPPRSDIVLHLPVLEWFAARCRSAVEFGVRDGHSTTALLQGLGKNGPNAHLLSCDIVRPPVVDLLLKMEGVPCKWSFAQMDTGAEADAHLVSDCDLLFVDTLHTAAHVARELVLHGRKAHKYLVFHDTATCGEFDCSGPNPRAPGILPAVRSFRNLYQDYRIAYETDSCNGLLILERFSS